MRSAAWAGNWSVTQPWGCTSLLVEPWWQAAQCHWHCGLDVGLPMQTPLYAMRHGFVTGIGAGYLGILTDSGQTDWYVHGVYPSMRFGMAVSAGQSIGYSSNVAPSGGSTTGPHLHFEVQESGGHLNNPATSLDPIPVLAATFGASGSLATPHPQLHTSEDSNVAILFHPTITDRMDVLSIGSDGAVYHFFGTTDALTKGTAGSESWGGKFLPGTLSAAWYNDPANVRLVAQAIDSTGIAHIREVDTSGKVVRDWAPLMADATHLLTVGLPAVPVTAPADDDSGYLTKAALKAAVESIA